ncbi:MAG: metallothionein [Gammaproteobacteria bacterium]|nr:metallothionein [Gammaproteobacteria bacterium]
MAHAQSTTEPESRACAHEGCICRVAASAPQKGEQYCSDGCASGKGCFHPDCNCAALEAPME